ncbi:MAG: hydroxyphenylacetyl-CoA thioesterase PaaI [Chitinophagaceae bacterium]|nr:hydroxyphenylacetyl-CoA thioesterase PaaI [Chitinophagaceae bacterium]
MNPSPRQVVDRMLETDAFSRWLGIDVMELKEGYAKTQMTVRDEMLNGLGVAHGGIAFSLADSTFAFACNNRNQLSLALDTSINFLKPVMPGDVLTAEAKEIHNGRSTGLYHITVINQDGQQVAAFKGICYRSGKKILE